MERGRRRRIRMLDEVTACLNSLPSTGRTFLSSPSTATSEPKRSLGRPSKGSLKTKYYSK